MNHDAAAPADNSVATPSVGNLRRRATRVAGYAFWSAFGTILPLVFDRLIVHPRLAEELGEDIFGGLIWVLGVVNLVGYVGAAGFSTLLMRDYAAYSPAQAQLAYRCSLLLSTLISAILLIFSAVASTYFADQPVRDNVWALYVPLVIVGILRAVTYVLQTNLRISRAFKAIFIMQLIEGLVLCTNIFVARRKSLWLIGMIYVASVLATVPFATWNIDDVRLKSKWWDRSTARMLMMGWFAGAMISLINNSQIYVARLVVGAMAGAAQVAVLYPAIAISNIFVMPVTVIAQLVLSLLGGTNKFVLSGKKAVLYFIAVVIFSALFGACSWLFGRYVVTYLYPKFAPVTLSFYGWFAVANSFTCVMMMLRAVMLKYAPLKVTTWLLGIVLAVQSVGLLWLVPNQQAAGAARASCISAIVSAVIFTVYFFKMVHQQSRLRDVTEKS